MKLTPEQVSLFQELVWEYYSKHKRAMPWRDNPSPYNVVVSELMLQQTQVARVIPKYNAFLYTCDSFAHLASMPLSEVLTLWSGLGYNRRAKFLHQTAIMVMQDFAGQLPATLEELVKLPGIGKNTAGAVLAYAYNQPVVFVETNIRTVFFHHFFTESPELVHDNELLSIAEQVLPKDNPREWYWALMDYGSHLKQERGARLTMSRHYKKQSPLKGSVREVRGRIIKTLTTGPCSLDDLSLKVNADERFPAALQGLIRDGMIVKTGDEVSLTVTSGKS